MKTYWVICTELAFMGRIIYHIYSKLMKINKILVGFTKCKRLFSTVGLTCMLLKQKYLIYLINWVQIKCTIKKISIQELNINYFILKISNVSAKYIFF